MSLMSLMNRRQNLARRATQPKWVNLGLLVLAMAALGATPAPNAPFSKLVGVVCASLLFALVLYEVYLLVWPLYDEGDNYITNHRPFGAGRDIGHGPDLFTTDMRLSRNFALGEKLHLEALIEGFNLENRTNFRSVNNIVGDVPLSSLPNPIQGFRGDPTQPLAYTSAFDPREFQVGLKIIY